MKKGAAPFLKIFFSKVKVSYKTDKRNYQLPPVPPPLLLPPPQLLLDDDEDELLLEEEPDDELDLTNMANVIHFINSVFLQKLHSFISFACPS